jgi:hypothetical protein
MLQRRKGSPAGRAAARLKLHSIPGLMRGRAIAGAFEAGGKSFDYSFTPSAVAVANGTIELTGTFGVGTATKATLTGVRATLASTQGALGQAPRLRRELLAMTSQGAETAKADMQEGTHPSPPAANQLPITEATGSRGFVGVMYFRLSPLDAKALGVPADMSAVQLNARLAPTSETERELQWLYSGLVMAVLGERPDARAATAHVDAINDLLRA